MIENERQLQHSYDQLARLYRLREAEAAETRFDLSTRDDIVAGADMMIHKIEREIAAYLAARPE